MQIEGIDNEEMTGASGDTYTVVVGVASSMTDRQVSITYEGLEGRATIKVNRPDFGPGGSTGIGVTDGYRAYAFKQVLCGVCENNNHGTSKRRWITIDNEEKRTVHKCPECSGGGYSNLGTNTANIDAADSDTTEQMARGETPAHARPVFSSILAGGRGGKTVEWDTPIVARPLMAMGPSGHIVPVSPPIIQHFNEAYADEDNPHGVQIGRTKTGVYATLQHWEPLQPIIDQCEAAGIPYHAWGANRGQDAYVDIELAKNGSRDEVFATLKALKADGVEGDYGHGGENSVLNNPAGLVKLGIRIKHSFDGALTMNGYAERVACLNGMVATNAVSLLKAQHKHGVIDRMDFDALGGHITTIALQLFEEMSAVEGMNNIPLNETDWERLLALLEQRKILSFPKLGQQGQLTGGRVFRAATQGWADPSQDWVAVGGDNPGTVGSLNQAYNVMTGITTHHVEANDIHGTVTGGGATSITGTEKQLSAVHDVLREIQNDAFQAYITTMGQEPANADDVKGDLTAFVAHHGIPMLNDIEADERGRVLPELTNEDADGNEISMRLTAQYVGAA